MDPRLAGLPRDSDGGTILKDRYVIERELGRGGIGVVYLARDRQLLSRKVVVKVLLEDAARGDWVKKKFQHEVEALARIDHPGVVGVLDAGTMPDGSPFLVMQFVEGVTLRSILMEGRMPLARIGRICRQIGSALDAAHEKGVYHRDLKPDNVMVQTLANGEDRVKLIDFGIATVKDTDRLDAKTAATTIAGTVFYMAPEQLMGMPSASSDIYALGVIAYEAITGRLPFMPQTPYQMPEMQRQGVAVPPSHLRQGLPPEAEAAVLRALAFEPERRHATARELGDELDYLLGDIEPGAQGTSRHGAAATGRARPDTLVATDLSGGVDARPTAVVAPTTPDTGGRAADDLATTPIVDRSLPDRTIRVEPARPETARTVEAGAPPAAPRAWPRVALGLAAVAAVLAGVMWWAARETRAPAPGPQPPAPPSRTETAPEPAGRRLSYFVTVQKYRDGRPYQEPFRLGHEILFEKDYRVRLTVSSPQEGHLYVVNESPPGPGGAPEYVLLFPSPTTNGGSEVVPPGREVQLPEATWFAFDDQAGVETLWLVWAAEPVPELEAAKPAANPRDRGVITNAEQRDAVAAFLERHAREGGAAGGGASQTVTEIGPAPGPVLVHPVRLFHH